MTTARSDDAQHGPSLEPTLQELLSEPIVRMMMGRDGVEEDELVALMEQIQKRPPNDNWPRAA
jgi:hypothetical protein